MCCYSPSLQILDRNYFFSFCFRFSSCSFGFVFFFLLFIDLLFYLCILFFFQIWFLVSNFKAFQLIIVCEREWVVVVIAVVVVVVVVQSKHRIVSAAALRLWKLWPMLCSTMMSIFESPLRQPLNTQKQYFRYFSFVCLICLMISC